MSRSLRAVLAVVCALLLSQWTLAAHACPAYAGAALAAAPMTADTGCDHDAGVAAVCFKHCADEDHAGVQPTWVAAPPLAARFWQPEAVADVEHRAARPEPPRPHALRLTILYCVSLT